MDTSEGEIEKRLNRILARTAKQKLQKAFPETAASELPRGAGFAKIPDSRSGAPGTAGIGRPIPAEAFIEREGGRQFLLRNAGTALRLSSRDSVATKSAHIQNREAQISSELLAGRRNPESQFPLRNAETTSKLRSSGF